MCTWSMWMVSIRVRTISGVSLGTMYITGSAERITALQRVGGAAVDGARDRRAQVEPRHAVEDLPPLLAGLDLAELELAQLGDGVLARLGDEPHPLDLDLGDLAAVLGDIGLDLALGALAAAPARAAG